MAISDPEVNESTGTAHQAERQTEAAPDRRQESPDPRDAVPELGFREYWYPALAAHELKRNKQKRVQLCGDTIGLYREGEEVYALSDVCPHRGAPMTFGRRYFPGAISCAYHGWTFRLSDGQCLAALTDGPQSVIPRMACLKSYPAQERAGIVWVYMGQGTVPPLEDDVPEEILQPDASVNLILQEWDCNWRPTMDNAIDSAHAMFLHRVSVWLLFSKVPAWIRVKLVPKDRWMGLVMESAFMQADYPGLGKYPKAYWWRRTSTPNKTFIRLPGVFKVEYDWWTQIRWAVPIDAHRTRNFNWAVKRGSWLSRLFFRLNLMLWLKWVHYKDFGGQDKWICEALDYESPEKLCRTDVPVIEWRKLAPQSRDAGYRTAAIESAEDGVQQH